MKMYSNLRSHICQTVFRDSSMGSTLICHLGTVVHTMSVWIKISTAQHPSLSALKASCFTSCWCFCTNLARPISLISLCPSPCGSFQLAAAQTFLFSVLFFNVGPLHQPLPLVCGHVDQCMSVCRSGEGDCAHVIYNSDAYCCDKRFHFVVLSCFFFPMLGHSKDGDGGEQAAS